MQNQKLIIKFDRVSQSDQYRLRRIEGTATAESIIRLIDLADLRANPREAKVGNITDEIVESLEKTPEIFHFKSKGLLLAAHVCEALERNRFRLAFEDPDIEGVLDGGHNTLALAIYFLRRAIGEEHEDLRKLKRWEDLSAVWAKHRDAIKKLDEADLDFLTPLEVIFPQDSDDGADTFQDAILDIAQARNNNAQLTLETKANKAGYYDYIKEQLDPQLVDQVEWKSNDGGRIKARDLVALAWVPLSVIDDPDLPITQSFNPVHIYRNKGACTKAFNDLMEKDGVSAQTKGAIRKLKHSGVKSALKLMKELPLLFDQVYRAFPEAYNKASSGFGRINCVRVYDKNKKATKKYLRKPPKSKFYQGECDYDFPDGFISPLIWALRELMEYKNGAVSWKTDPEQFIKDNLNEVLQNFYSIIQLSNYDPQKVGKTLASYNLASSSVRFLIK